MITEEIDEDIAEEGAAALDKTLFESIVENAKDRAFASNSLDVLEVFAQFVPNGKYSLRLITDSKDSLRKLKDAAHRLSQDFDYQRPSVTSL